MERSRIKLRGLGAQFEGQVWEADGILRIGRMEGLEIILNVASVSRRHAEVLLTSLGWAVRDLGSMNGTFLNGVRVGRTEQILREGDEVQFGDVNMVVKIEADAVEPAGKPEEDGAKLKTSGSYVRVQAVSQHPWEKAVEGLHNNQRLKQGKGFLALLRTGYHLSHIASLDDLLQLILEDTVAVLEAQRGCIILADEMTGFLHLRAVSTSRTLASPEKCFSRTLAQRTFDTGESLLCRDVHEDMTMSIARGSMTSIICAALRTPRKRLGVLHLDRGIRQESFNQEDFVLADAIAAGVSLGIESTQLMEQQRDISVRTVTALAQAVELRDRYTGGHTQRVTTYALMLAEELKLSPTEQQQLRIGTPLHDIGKIGIDDAILRKPGKLTHEEYEQMKSHTVKGAEILETIPDLVTLIPIIRHHHEHWDGSGYPDGLARDQISRLARIVAVADAFDAMTSDRSYRPAIPVDQAFAEFSANAGTHFDPEVVQALLRLRPRIEALIAQEGSFSERADALTETSPQKEIMNLLK